MKTAALALLAAALLLLAACGGRNDDAEDSPTAVSATPSAITETSPTSTLTPAGGAATVTPASGAATVTPARTAPVSTPTERATTLPGAASQQIARVEDGRPLVALTFDMGGRVEPAVDIMEWLIDNNVRATIFMTGAMAENQNTEAGRDVLRLVAAHPDLFDLGNHSYSHPDFRDLSAEAMREELARTEQGIGRTIAIAPRPWFRPPFGGLNAAVLSAVGPAGYGYTIMWDVDTIDWRPEADGGPTAAAMANKVVTNARAGSIVLMHLGGYNTLQALPAMVGGLRAKGLSFATISDLVGVQ